MKKGASCSSSSVDDDVGFLLETAPNDHLALLVEFLHGGALLGVLGREGRYEETERAGHGQYCAHEHRCATEPTQSKCTS